MACAGGQDCQCTLYVPPMLFGAACSVCGHTEPAHRSATTQALPLAVSATATRSDRHSSTPGRHHHISPGRKVTNTTTPGSTSKCRTPGCREVANPAIGHCTACLVARVNFEHTAADSPRGSPICLNRGCNGPPRAGSLYCRRSCEPGGQFYRGIDSNGADRSRSTRAAAGDRRPCARTGCQRWADSDSHGHYCSSSCHGKARAVKQAPTVAQGALVEFIPSTNRAGQMTLRLNIGAAPPTDRNPPPLPTKRRTHQYRQEQQATMLGKAATAAEAQGDTAKAEDLFLTAANLYQRLILEDAAEAAPSEVTDEAVSTARSDVPPARTVTWRHSRRNGSLSPQFGAQQMASLKISLDRLGNPLTRQKELDQYLLQQAGWDLPTQRSVLALIRQHTLGRPEVVPAALKCCLQNAGLCGALDSYWRAFDRASHKSWISQSDFLMGVAALDPYTPHTGLWCEIRAQYIFRFYATGRGLDFDGLVNLLQDTRQAATDPPLHAKSPKTMAAELHPSQTMLSKEDLVAMVASNSIQGTCNLFRFSLRDRLGMFPQASI